MKKVTRNGIEFTIPMKNTSAPLIDGTTTIFRKRGKYRLFAILTYNNKVFKITFVDTTNENEFSNKTSSYEEGLVKDEAKDVVDSFGEQEAQPLWIAISPKGINLPEFLYIEKIINNL